MVSIKCDVCKEEEVLALFEQVKKELGGVDVLICNAGLAHNEPLLSGNTSQWREMTEVKILVFLQQICIDFPVQVNIIGLCVCTREFVKQAKERGMDNGHILLLSR